MQTDSPSPAQVLGRLTKVLGLLGISNDDLQVVIDHPNAREELRRAWRQAMYPPEVRLLRAMLGSLDQLLTESHRDAAAIDFEELLGSIDERPREVVRLRFGFRDGKVYTLEEVAKELDMLTRERVRQVEAKALSKLRRRHQDAQLRKEELERLAAGPSDVDVALRIMSVDDLRFSDRVNNAFKRARIDYVGQLLEQREVDLLAITNFGELSLLEVIAKLAELGVALRPADPAPSAS